VRFDNATCRRPAQISRGRQSSARIELQRMVTLEGRVFGRCSRSKRAVLDKTTEGIYVLEECKPLFTERLSNARVKVVAKK